MDADHFETLVAEALDSIPPDFQAYLDNVAVVIETWPRPHHMARLGLGPGSLLLGLYEGVPRTQRPAAMNLALPDKITIFQGPIELVVPGEGLVRDAAIRPASTALYRG